jgi:hypothetical protein
MQLRIRAITVGSTIAERTLIRDFGILGFPPKTPATGLP